MRYIEIKFNVLRTETYSFPAMYNTYGWKHKSFDKHMDISEKIHDFCIEKEEKNGAKNKVTLVFYFKNSSCMHSTPYVIVITGKLGASAFQ